MKRVQFNSYLICKDEVVRTKSGSLALVPDLYGQHKCFSTGNPEPVEDGTNSFLLPTLPIGFWLPSLQKDGA